jgi:hypothetical protein
LILRLPSLDLDQLASNGVAAFQRHMQLGIENRPELHTGLLALRYEFGSRRLR